MLKVVVLAPNRASKTLLQIQDRWLGEGNVASPAWPHTAATSAAPGSVYDPPHWLNINIHKIHLLLFIEEKFLKMISLNPSYGFSLIFEHFEQIYLEPVSFCSLSVCRRQPDPTGRADCLTKHKKMKFSAGPGLSSTGGARRAGWAPGLPCHLWAARACLVTRSTIFIYLLGIKYSLPSDFSEGAILVLL